MGAAEDLGRIIGKNLADTDNLNQEMSHTAGTDTNIVFPIENIETEQLAVRIKLRNIAGNTLIWGHSIFGLWGTGKWGSTANYSFVLGHSVAGVLGTSKLGSNASAYETDMVVSPNNQFKEYFPTTNYKDTGNSTSTTNTDDEEEEFTTGEIYQSEIIYKDDTTITKALVNIYIRGGSGTVIHETTQQAGQVFNIVID